MRSLEQLYMKLDITLGGSNSCISSRGVVLVVRWLCPIKTTHPKKLKGRTWEDTVTYPTWASLPSSGSGICFPCKGWWATGEGGGAPGTPHPEGVWRRCSICFRSGSPTCAAGTTVLVPGDTVWTIDVSAHLMIHTASMWEALFCPWGPMEQSIFNF